MAAAVEPVPVEPPPAAAKVRGAGAKVLGGISVGADSIIGANAVVTTDVPAGSMATGNPALITPLRREQLESAFFRSRRP